MDCRAAQEPENAHSHLLSMVLGNSETVPVTGGKLALGQWQVGGALGAGVSACCRTLQMHTVVGQRLLAMLFGAISLLSVMLVELGGVGRCCQ